MRKIRPPRSPRLTPAERSAMAKAQLATYTAEARRNLAVVSQIIDDLAKTEQPHFGHAGSAAMISARLFELIEAHLPEDVVANIREERSAPVRP